LQEERGVGPAPTSTRGGATSPDEIPDDVLAEKDALDRLPHDARGRPESVISSEATELTEDMLAEHDAEARAVEDALRERQAGR
jgi:hypothetical protein